MNNRLLAEAVDIGQDTKINGNIGVGDTYFNFSTIINLLLKNSITIAGIILVALLIFGGITFIMSAGSGDAKKADQGKKTITASIIGFAIVIFAYLIITIIETITGLHILDPSLNS